MDNAARTRLTLMPIAVLVAAVVFSAAMAVAAIPDSQGVIHGCYRKKTGALRVIDTGKGQDCVQRERAVSWNERGPRGKQGTRGDRGARGPRGLQGVAGESLHGITESLVGSYAPATEDQGSVSWTQPADSFGYLHYRMSIVAPSAPCASVEAAVVGNFRFLLDGAQFETLSDIVTVGPGETGYAPTAFSLEYYAPVFPGDHEFTVANNTETIAPDCLDTEVRFELMVESVGSTG